LRKEGGEMSREKFEALPDIKKRMLRSKAKYNNDSNFYECYNYCGYDDESYLDGAYYAFCEQEKKIEKLMHIIIELSAENEKLENRLERLK